ncbi:hypothetical protein B2K11_06585 [Microbacterium sp. B35-30]|nr:hypothetical protein B2K11_06585 [Microbacterium sp. B35-30]
MRSTVLSAVAVAVTAILVSIGGAALADDIVVDGDTIAIGTQTDIDFGTLACGATATRQVALYVKSSGHTGSGQQVFMNDSFVDVGATTSAPVSVTVAPGTAGDIKVPTNWQGTVAYPNNTLTPTGATATLAPNTSVSGDFTGTVSFSGTGVNGGGNGISVGPVLLTVRWKVGPCNVATATTTTVSCPASIVYTGSALTPCTATVTGEGGFSQTLAVTHAANTNVGTASAAAAFAGDATHKPSSGDATFQITKASSRTTVECPASVTYTGSALTPCTATVTGASLAQELAPTYIANTNAGTATASAIYGGDENHAGSTDETTFEILAASASCEVTGYAAEYDGDAHGATGSCTGIGGADVSAGLDLGASFTDVPGGTAYWSFGLSNYASQSGSVTIGIDQAASSVSLLCSDTVYTGAAQETCSATVTGAGGLSEDVVVTYTANTDAGTATAKAIYGGDINHKASEASTTFEIAKAATTTKITCTEPNAYTGSEITPCTARVTGAGGLDASFQPSYANNVGAGNASVSFQYAGDANHEPSQDATTFVIDKASSSITLTCPASVVYTGAPHTPCTATVSAVGLADFAADVSYTDNTDAGSASASAAWAGDQNHVGSNVSGGFQIARAPSVTVVTCPTAAIPFTGSAITPCTARVTGAGGLDQAVTPVVYANNTSVGTATASAVYPGDANHLGSNGSATFAIEAWTLNGFYKPVDMGSAVINIVKGGSTVPLKFTVLAGTTEVTDLATLNASFVVKGVSCDPTDATSDDLLATTGGTTLRYDASAHQWIQNWQTPKTAGKCYTVVMTTADGSQLSAQFKIK